MDSSRSAARRAMGRPEGPSGPSTVTLHAGRQAASQQALSHKHTHTDIATTTHTGHTVCGPHLNRRTSSGAKASTMCQPALSMATGTCGEVGREGGRHQMFQKH